MAVIEAGISAEGGRADLTGAPNFRDFGGCTTRTGGRVKQGLLFRSSRLSELTAQDVMKLSRLEIRTVFDLRSRHERGADPTRWPGMPYVQTFGTGPTKSFVDLAQSYSTDVAGARSLMMDFYAAMPRVLAPAVASILQALAADAAPCIIHCSAGKDRTGVAAALVLAALDVDEAAISRDYTCTNERIEPKREMARALSDTRSVEGWRRYSPEASAALLAASPDYLKSALEAINADYGSMQGYFETALDLSPVTIACLRQRLAHASVNLCDEPFASASRHHSSSGAADRPQILSQGETA